MIKLVLFLLFLAPSSFAQSSCDSDISSLAVRAGGRIKPMKVLAYETLKFLSTEKKPFGLNYVQAFCKLSFQFFGQNNDLDLPIKIEHVEAKKLLNINEDAKSILFSDLSANEMEVRSKYISIKTSTPLKKELNKLMTRLKIHKELTGGKTWTLIDPKTKNWKEMNAYSQADFTKDLLQQRSLDKEVLNDTHKLELKFFNYKPFSYAMLFVLLAIFALVIFPSSKAAIFLTASSIIIQVIGIVIRILISGRAPITNMYETVMFSGFGALIIALILTVLKKDKIFLLGGLAYNFLCLLMMTLANNMLDPAIKPLVPVLRDNFWLSTHVTTIILSYAALALSWILANIALFQKIFNKESNDKRQSKIIYICIQVGTVLLSAGVILGGVWADYSWGRFWGWDPKETWSLIVLLIYMAILHGRYTSWIKDKLFIPLCAAAFMSVMMAWFGVNYILASGLHSYGFSEGGAIFLGSLFAAQSLILVISFAKDRLSS